MASRSDRGRVLVTGLDGFTGSYLGPLLRQRGYEVIGAGEPEFNLLRPESIASVITSAQPEFVIHLAGISFVAHEDAAALYAVNTVGTTSLLSALEVVAPRLRKVILASTSQVYGNATDDPITERTATAPINHYACSKLAMEHMAHHWFARLPILITRPFNYIGPGQGKHFLLPKLIDHFRRQASVIALGNLGVERDFLDVRAVADIYVKLLESRLQSTAVNIASGVARSLASILDDLTRITGHHLSTRIDPALVRHNEVKRLVGSSENLRHVVGDLAYSDFEATLRWMLEQVPAPA
ncbi:MAG: NAD-dependent epimerase/dehydratase family protein [Burkholderiaceae bacterium]